MEADRGVKTGSYLWKLSILFVVLAVSFVICLSLGSADLSFSDVIYIIFHPNSDVTNYQIIYEIRLPRLLLAIAVGGGLSIAGAVFQALLMNPLAEPYILGISSGGTFGAILSILLGFSLFFTQLFAFIGALTVVFLVFRLGKKFGELEPNVLLLSGVMIGAFFSALILLMMSLLGDSLRTAVFWLIGNISFAKLQIVLYVLVITIIVSVVLSLNSHKYNILSLGSDTAKHLGINTSFVKNLSYILASIMVGAIVSVSGIIGFVGLLIPHVCRFIFGVDNRIVVPASFLIGAAYLIWADTLARILIAPSELPVGAITAIIGAPVFIYLLRKRFYLIN